MFAIGMDARCYGALLCGCRDHRSGFHHDMQLVSSSWLLGHCKMGGKVARMVARE